MILCTPDLTIARCEAEEAFTGQFGEDNAAAFDALLDDYQNEFFACYQVWQEEGKIIALYTITYEGIDFGLDLLELLKRLGAKQARMECGGDGFDVIYTLYKNGNIKTRCMD